MKPILFNAEMVCAILEGRKTVTRRVVKPQPPATAHVSKVRSDYGWSFWEGNPEKHYMKPPFQAGDILWVRETWNCLPIPEPLRGTSKTYWYKADGAEPEDKWRPSIHMPREAARIFLRVTGVQVERLQDITEKEAGAEGPRKAFEYNTQDGPVITLDEDGYFYFGFKALWNSTIKAKDLSHYGWEANPWVWVIEFERISKGEAVGRCAE